MRKTTNSEKKTKGTLQKCRVKNPPAYEVLTKVPSPIFELNSNGREYFTKFCQMLIDNKLMTAAYIPIITRAARYYELYKKADDNVRTKGLTQVADSGWEQKGAWWTIMTDTEDRVTKIEEKFGMTLLSGSKLDIKKPEKENPFDAI